MSKNPKMENAVFNWSGGKDSSLALYKILQKKEINVIALLTSLNAEYKRVSMHGVRHELLIKQAESIQIPLKEIWLSESVNMEQYSETMNQMWLEFKNQGVSTSIFGDIFLEDLKEYRNNQLAKVGMKGLYPLWKESTQDLALEFIETGFKTIITCVDTRYLDSSFVGRLYDYSFLNDLPQGLDPCGENGEFHSFAFDGPIFNKPITFTIGDKILKEFPLNQNQTTPKNQFCFIDLIPTD